MCLSSFQGQIVRSYKTSRRREDDISIVTATFNVIFEPGSSRVHDLRLAFGGMGPTTVLTPKTSNALRGRLWGEELLQIACSSLADEMTLDPSCPGGMVSYRRTLVLSLFYKFYLSVLQTLGEQVMPLPARTAGITVPSGQDMEDVVGRPLMHVSAEKQATGEAQYCDDLRPADNELYLSLICSTRAHAKILSIDCSEARAMPSVVCVLFAEDVPGSNGTGPVVYDETVLAQGEVTCVGHVIGAVVAETQGDAQRAAKSVKIQYQDLPAVITIQDAIEAQSFYEPIRTLQKGDLETGFKQSDHILEGELHMGGQEHFYLETNVTVAVPRDQDEIEIFSSTQSPSKTQSLVARALGISSNRVHVRVKRMGGGFGGKDILSTVVALAAHRYDRPVRCMLDRDEDMLVTGGRHPFYSKYKVSPANWHWCRLISACDTTYDSSVVMDRALMHLENSYLVPNVRGRGIMCQTHLPSNTAFRGFGGPQGMMVCEDWISAIALKLGRTSEQIRELNLYSEGDLTPYNQVLESFTLRRCWDECLDRAKIHERRTQIHDFNRQNRWTKRGLAVVPTKFGIAFNVVFLNQAGALVHIYTDGSVLVAHGGTEMGQGLHTKMIQVCSRALGIPHVCETSSHSVANTSPTAASVSSDLNGAAVLNACEILGQRLQPYKDRDPQGAWESWVKAAYFDRVNLSANGFYRTPGLGYDFETNSGRAFNYFTYGVCCSEVEIDCLTGTSTIVMDVGNSLNPAIDIGQVGLSMTCMHGEKHEKLHTERPGQSEDPTKPSCCEA
uniref:Xanthine dehydrogenase n=1 Tax=Periophthalmus magnuspinnatus TaxID=409849 RepID=A0A3B3ZI89_9GOBI